MLKSAITPHNFKLQIANESLSALPSSLRSKLTKIEAAVTIDYHPNSNKLIANFYIKMPECLYKSIEWQLFDSQKVTRQDFLWESSCLELFIGHTQTSEYIEINASPQGQFAVYHFDDYRQPKQMPPRKLVINDQPNKNAKITWLPTTKTFKRSFEIELTQLPANLQTPNLLNPTLILNLNNNDTSTPLFFACKHATPADFHDPAFWQTI